MNVHLSQKCCRSPQSEWLRTSCSGSAWAGCGRLFGPVVESADPTKALETQLEAEETIVQLSITPLTNVPRWGRARYILYAAVCADGSSQTGVLENKQ
jgi:hypothetical protein